MKKKLLIITLTILTLTSFMTSSQKAPANIYDLSFVSLSGNPIQLSAFKGKKILFVNVASKCGFTAQYKDLQALHKKYQDKLVVIGFPCNQFGSQESGSEAEIKTFCQKNYGVEFLMSSKIEVKGDQQHPIYQWLTSKELNGLDNSSVKWNFQKYLVSESGQLINFWYSVTGPLSEKITKNL